MSGIDAETVNENRQRKFEDLELTNMETVLVTSWTFAIATPRLFVSSSDVQDDSIKASLPIYGY